jgi:pyruvate,water dikinase
LTVVDAPAIRWIDDEGCSPADLGGKVSSLAELTAAGFAVPPAFGITTAAFRRFAEAAGLPARVAAIRGTLDTGDLAAVERASAQIAGLIDAAEMPAALEAEIRDAYARLEERAGDWVPVAVRSSGVNEDLEGASFAGQYDTYLWIRGADDVLAHVRRCWAGLFNPAVLTYRPGDAVDAADADDGDALPGMCVGVQVMVRARSAGVMFTLDPLSGDRSTIVIESCWGLGEGVVKGDVTPDRHRVDKVTLELLESEIASKLQEHRFDAARGEVVLADVPGDRRDASCLETEQVIRLAELAKRIERHREAPQDIEWAVDQGGNVRVLQVRPETVWSHRPAKSVIGAGGTRGVDRVLAKFMTGAAQRP